MKLETPTLEDVTHIISNMREADYQEYVEASWLPKESEKAEHLDEFIQMVMSTGGLKYVAKVDDEPIMLIGLHSCGLFMGQAWMCATDSIKKIGLSLTRESIKHLHQAMAGGKIFHRVQAFSACFHTEAHRWLEALGFKNEGTMKKYGISGVDFYLFAMTTDDIKES